ncbi:MAG TPA: Omp28-related outer membrane protein [Ignavibacteriaceae bacterium]|nr:Omp28-related outer membrane protein [Ignavibacteriaceae bacterium]
MKKLLLLNLLLLFIISGISEAQERRIVLLEEATNASCGPCAQNNPNLQAFFKSHFGGVISVRYHASWPGTDPMYNANPTENTARIVTYYGINGVPNYLMDGTNYGVPSDPIGMVGQMNQDLGMNSPVKIRINSNIDADSVRATITLTAVSTVTQANLKFRIAVIERMIQYATPPGSNGEKVFPDVMRKMYPDPDGYTINSINAGDEFTYYVSYPVNAAWVWQDLAVVGWLQSDATKEVIQSNISIPTYSIESDSPLGEFLEKNQNYSKILKIKNDNDVELQLRLKFTDVQVPSGWDYNLTYNGNSYDSVDIAIAPGDSGVFNLEIITNSNPGSISLALFAQNLNDPYSYGYTANYFGMIKNGNVLFIDDDGGTNSETYYFPAFDSAGVQYSSIEEGFLSGLTDQIMAANFKAVFWSIGWGFPAFIQSDVNFLETFLNNGGNLFIAGQDIGWDIFDVSGGSNFPEAQEFYHNYLDARYINDNAGSSSFTGVAGTLGDSITTTLSGIAGGFYPEQIGSYSGVSDTIFQYSGTTKYGALSYDAGTYKTIYLGVGLEQFNSSDARQKIIQRAADWFSVLIPLQVNLLLPEDGTTLNGDTVQCIWATGTPLVTNYWFELATDSMFTMNYFVDSTLTDTSIVLTHLNNNTTYWWRVRAQNNIGWGEFSSARTFKINITGIEENNNLPRSFSLAQNYPNPFNPSTMIKYEIPKTSNVSLKVYNSVGQEIAILINGTKAPGKYEVRFDAKNLASGVYFYKLNAGNFVSVQKMIVIK